MQSRNKLKTRKNSDRNFESLASECYARLYRSALFQTVSPEDARDLVQDTFTIGFKLYPSFRGDSDFYTWIYKIYHNLLLNHRKQKKMYINRFGTIEEGTLELYESTESAPDILMERIQNKNKIRDALSKLPEDFREILVLRHFEEFSYKEIAKILDCKTGTVKSRIHKARELLKKILR